MLTQKSDIAMSQILQEEVKSVLSLVIKGRIPSKKNSRNLFFRKGKMFNIPSKDYAAWHKTALLQIGKINFKNYKFSQCKLVFWAPDKRAADLSNKTESIMDLLVDAKIIDDDNWWVVNKLTLEFAGVDKSNPRCEITLLDFSKE